MTPNERRAALRRRKVLVDVFLIVAISTLFISMYTMALGHEALAWFGFAAASGLTYLAHRAEEGK